MVSQWIILPLPTFLLPPSISPSPPPPSPPQIPSNIQEGEEALRRHMVEQGGAMSVETMVQARTLRQMYATLALAHFGAAVQNNAVG